MANRKPNKGAHFCGSQSWRWHSLRRTAESVVRINSVLIWLPSDIGNLATAMADLTVTDFFQCKIDVHLDINSHVFFLCHFFPHSFANALIWSWSRQIDVCNASIMPPEHQGHRRRVQIRSHSYGHFVDPVPPFAILPCWPIVSPISPSIAINGSTIELFNKMLLIAKCYNCTLLGRASMALLLLLQFSGPPNGDNQRRRFSVGYWN